MKTSWTLQDEYLAHGLGMSCYRRRWCLLIDHLKRVIIGKVKFGVKKSFGVHDGIFCIAPQGLEGSAVPKFL